MLIDPKMEAHIKMCLDIIEKDKQVKVLYAAEAGSRAWGLESQDSDYDVRFIYMHIPPLPHYLSLDYLRKRDTIEMNWATIHRGPETLGEVDAVGWDLKKALYQFRKFNPNMIEWLWSPQQYVNDRHNHMSIYGTLMKCLVPNIITDGKENRTFANKQTLIQHYYHMARNNYREYLRTDTVWTKKYLYVIRPLLACIWLEINDSPPPVVFEVLLSACREYLQDGRYGKGLTQELIHEINTLVQRKRAGDELSTGPRIDALHNFINLELHHFKHTSWGFPKMDDHDYQELTQYLEHAFYDFLWLDDDQTGHDNADNQRD